MEPGTLRLLIAGTVDVSGAAAAVAESDPESLFREVRLLARSADLAVVVAASGDGAEALLAAAGFDAVACPEARSPAPAEGPAAVRLRCAGALGFATPASPAGPIVTVWEGGRDAPSAADVTVASLGGALAVEAIGPPVGRTRLVVAGLGALLSGEATTSGALLEVLLDGNGVIAYRIGRTTHTDFRVHFTGWDLPEGDAVLLGGEWWALARFVTPAAIVRPPADFAFGRGDLIAAALGDVTGDGMPDLAASYRHPFRPSALSEAYPGAVGVDRAGRSAHLGVFTTEGEALWAAGYLPRPVGDLAACDGAVALAYTGLDDPAVVATGAAQWRGLSLHPAPELLGAGIPGCADVDGDGTLDPVILGRAD